MKKMILSIILCVALMLGAFVAWSCYKDLLALLLFCAALVPSCLFEEGRQEYKSSKR